MTSHSQAAGGGIFIKKMQPSNLPFLHTFSRKAYSLNFHHHWEKGGLEPYLEKVFGLSILETELADPAIHYYVVFDAEKPILSEEELMASESEPIAFMKLDLFSNLPDQDPAAGIELDKLYVLPTAQGNGAGKILMEKAFELAKEQQKKLFWLGVIDTNREAIAFYQRWGFRFHSATRITLPGFREERRGMWRMFLALDPA